MLTNRKTHGTRMCANSNTALLNAPDFKLPFSIPFSSLMRTSYNIVWVFSVFRVLQATQLACISIHLGRRHQKDTIKGFTVSKYRKTRRSSKLAHHLCSLLGTSEAEAISVFLRPFSIKTVP